MAKTLAEPVDFETMRKSLEGILESINRMTEGELLSKHGGKKALQSYRKLLQNHSRLIKGAKLHAINTEKSLVSRKKALGESAENQVVDVMVTGESKVEVPE